MCYCPLRRLALLVSQVCVESGLGSLVPWVSLQAIAAAAAFIPAVWQLVGQVVRTKRC